MKKSICWQLRLQNRKYRKYYFLEQAIDMLDCTNKQFRRTCKHRMTTDKCVYTFWGSCKSVWAWGANFRVIAALWPTTSCGSGVELGARRWVSPAGLLTGLTGDEWSSWVLQRHLWRTHIVASPGEKTEQSGNAGGISYRDVISHKTFSCGQMKEGGTGGEEGRGQRDGGKTEEGQKMDNGVSGRDTEERVVRWLGGLSAPIRQHVCRKHSRHDQTNALWAAHVATDMDVSRWH